MKYIVFGDIHGRNEWKRVVEKESFDKVIFLGDYVTSREGIYEDKQLENLKDIFNFYDTNKGKVILLRGNHDMEALKYPWADCNPRFYNHYLYENRDEFLSRSQWIYVDNNLVFSHAGVSKTFFTNLQNKYKISSLEEINNIEPCEDFGFTPCKMSDYYGISKTQPLTWIRPGTLLDDSLENITYIVGHSTVSKIFNEKNEVTNSDIWLCDCMLKEYLIIENNEFKTKNILI